MYINPTTKLTVNVSIKCSHGIYKFNILQWMIHNNTYDFYGNNMITDLCLQTSTGVLVD